MQYTRSSAKILLTRMTLLLLLTGVGAFQQTVAQTQLGGTCPEKCGIKIQVTNATLTEAIDGVQVNVEWTLVQAASEIKLSGFEVFAEVDLGLDRVNKAINLALSERKATIKLSRVREFDTKDVKAMSARVTARATALANIPVTNNVTSKIISEGQGATVEAAWGDPGVLPCSANFIDVQVTAKNERENLLNGSARTDTATRSAKAELSGALIKRGLHDPTATVKVVNHLIECRETKSTTSPLTVAPRDNSGQTKVTLADISFRENSGRIDPTINWTVVEPAGFKATGFNLKFDIEDAAGKIETRTTPVAADKRSAPGPQLAAGNFRRLTVTITATFQNDAKTTTVIREDKRSETPPKVILPPPPPPPPPAPKFEITNAFSTPVSDTHNVQVSWRASLPAGITVLSFVVDVIAVKAGSKSTVTQSIAFEGTDRQGVFKFSMLEVGKTIAVQQIKLLANLKRADGSIFQEQIKQTGFGGSSSGAVR